MDGYGKRVDLTAGLDLNLRCGGFMIGIDEGNVGLGFPRDGTSELLLGRDKDGDWNGL
jgi:hypothetical protein